jgi:hypothetical protein
MIQPDRTAVELPPTNANVVLLVLVLDVEVQVVQLPEQDTGG